MQGLFLLLAILSAAPGAASPARRVDPEVARWVEAFRTTGLDEQSQMRLVQVRGEGRTLVLKVELLPSMPAMINNATVVSTIAGGICSDAEAASFFTVGRSLRVEVSRDGRAVGTASIDHCPGPIGQGLTAATYAGAMQPMVGSHVENLTITGVRAEGDTLVITLDGPAGWRRSISQATIEAAFLYGLCEGDRPNDTIFDGTLGVRVLTTEAGRDPVMGSVVRACPTR